MCIYIYSKWDVSRNGGNGGITSKIWQFDQDYNIYFWTITPKKDSNKRDKIWTELDTYNMGLSKTSCLLPNLRTVSEC